MQILAFFEAERFSDGFDEVLDGCTENIPVIEGLRGETCELLGFINKLFAYVVVDVELRHRILTPQRLEPDEVLHGELGCRMGCVLCDIYQAGVRVDGLGLVPPARGIRRVFVPGIGHPVSQDEGRWRKGGSNGCELWVFKMAWVVQLLLLLSVSDGDPKCSQLTTELKDYYTSIPPWMPP